MQIDILHLYEQAQRQALTSQEVDWLESQLDHFPYFSLPHTILARQHARTESPQQQRRLLNGSAFSPNRRLFQEYMLSEAGPEKNAPKENVPAAAVVEPVAPATAPPSPPPAKEMKPAPAPAIALGPPVGKTNWYLQTQLQMRVRQYQGKLAELRAAVSAPVQPEAPALDPPAPERKVEVAEPTYEKKKKAGKKAKGKSQQDGPRKKTPAVAPSGEIVEDAYEIGAFSNFTFLDEVESEDSSEIDSALPRESVSLATPAVPAGYSELIIEEQDRRLEILVTPEQLATYFNGKLPDLPAVNNPASPRLQFNFQPVDLAINPGEKPGKFSPEEKMTPDVPAETAPPQADDLISRFIEEEPSIPRNPGSSKLKGDLSKPSTQDSDEWITETLGKIHAAQGNHRKAAEIYRKLGLIFPNKKAYFDDLIQKLKQ